MGVDEGGDRQPWTVALRLGELGQKVNDLFSEDAVSHGAAVRLGGTVGLTTDPPGEPERVESIGLTECVDGIGDESAVVVGGHSSSQAVPPMTSSIHPSAAIAAGNPRVVIAHNAT